MKTGLTSPGYEHMLIISWLRKETMPRPCCLRHIAFKPDADLFVPAGIPIRMLKQIALTLDELEALRLADLQGLYQEDAAGQMKVSRQTFARIVEKARRKVADALIHGRALSLDGGVVRMKTVRSVAGGRNRLCPCGCGARRKLMCKNKLKNEHNCKTDVDATEGKCRHKNRRKYENCYSSC